MKIIKTIWLWLLTALGIGTKLGKDKYFSISRRLKVGPWFVVEMSGSDRMVFLELAQQVQANDELTDSQRAMAWSNMRFQAIATCLRNRHGYMLYDAMNATHLSDIAQFPERLIKDALNAINELSVTPWLVIPEAANDEQGDDEADDDCESEERHVNP